MPPISTPIATATSAALNRITCCLLVSGRAGVTAYPRLAAVRAEAARVLGNRVLSRRRRGARHSGAQRGLAEAGRKLRRGGRRGRRHRGGRAPVADAGLNVADRTPPGPLVAAAVLTLAGP